MFTNIRRRGRAFAPNAPPKSPKRGTTRFLVCFTYRIDPFLTFPFLLMYAWSLPWLHGYLDPTVKQACLPWYWIGRRAAQQIDVTDTWTHTQTGKHTHAHTHTPTDTQHADVALVWLATAQRVVSKRPVHLRPWGIRGRRSSNSTCGSHRWPRCHRHTRCSLVRAVYTPRLPVMSVGSLTAGARQILQR